jgi:two-component system phosphate regulon sensor histidine kinase PhoR
MVRQMPPFSSNSIPPAAVKTYARSWSIFFRRFSRRRGFMWRGLLAWGIGCAMFFSDELGSFDTRLQVRGNQKVSDEIVLLTISRNEVRGAFSDYTLGPLGFKGIGSLHEIGDVTDSFYWDAPVWTDLLKKILSGEPKSVGVTLFFADSIPTKKMNAGDRDLFLDPRIFWAGLTVPNEQTQFPIFANEDHSNVGSIEILRDQDGIIRRFSQMSGEQNSDIPSLAQRLAGRGPSKNALPFINYRGDSSVFIDYTLGEVLNGTIPPAAFKDKIVLIGSERSEESQYLTPLGGSSRQALLAQMTNHMLEHRSIHRVATFWYLSFLFGLMLLTMFVLTQYPQTVAFVLAFLLATSWCALSIWVFDSFYFWLPITSALGTMISCYVIFLGYQANKIEREHFSLRQEQKYLQQLEQLKNNFVSLISHDLKTPIAKIQAILDRMILKNLSEEFQGDLKTLRQSNDELSRYIQSILRVLRVESRDFRLNVEVAEINDIIADAIKQLEPLAKEKRIEIVSELEPMFSSEFDQTLIREVLVNLIENAIKYSPEEGRVSLRSFERDDGSTQVEVSDTGEGIPQDEIPHIWGKFVRGKDQDMKTKGTGLGLYLVKFFIELHGGQVWIESTLGVGTKACFTLPVEYEKTDVKEKV